MEGTGRRNIRSFGASELDENFTIIQKISEGKRLYDT